MITPMKTPRFIYLASLAFMAVLILPQAARAASATWNGTTDALWSTDGNWSTTPVPGIGDTATFNNAGNSNTALTVGTISLSQVLFNTSSAAAYTLGSGTITFADGTTTAVLMNSTVTANEAITANLTLGTAIASNTTVQNDSTIGLLTFGGGIAGGSGGTAAAKTLTVTGAGNTTITGAISNGGDASGVGITKAGSGTLILTNGANSFTRAVSISGGTLRATDGTIYGAGDQNITTTVLGQVASNGVSFAGNSTAKTLDLRYNGQNDGTAQKLQLLNSKGGNLLINASSTNSTINVDRESGTGTNKTIAFFNSTIATASNLTVTGANGYSLGLVTLTVGTGGTPGDVTITPTTANVTIGTVVNSGALSNSHMLILDGTSSGNTITGAMTNGTGGTLSVTKSNTSAWTLSGASTYTGATTVSGGTLALGAANRIADTSNLIMAGGTFATGGFSETLGTLTLSAISTIDLGSGASALVFADSSGATWGTSIILSFVNFTAGVDTIRIGTTSGGLTLAQLGEITINGSAATIDASGFLAAAAIPEPSTWALLAGTAALAGTLFVRRSRRCLIDSEA